MENQKLIEVNDEDTAKEVFMRYSGNDYQIKNILGNNYNKYIEFARKDGNSRKWAEELCRDILGSIANGNTIDYANKFSMVGNLTEYYFSAYLIAEPFVKAWKKVIENEKPPVRVSCILKYLERFSMNCENSIEFILTLINETEEYLKKYAYEEFIKSRYASHEGHFRELSADLRRIAKEYSAPEKSVYSFVKTDAEILDIIKDSLMNEWNDTDIVKSETAELNCAYGVINDEIFLTGANYTANQSTLHSWEIIEFAVVILKEKYSCLFRCNLSDNGDFSFKSYLNKYPKLKEYEKSILDAILYYRNNAARDAFLAEQGVHSWRDLPKWNNYEYECRNKYLSQFPKVLRNVYARIPECSVKDAIIKLVDVSEEMIKSYQIKETDFAPPLTESEITEWEINKGIRLPAEYKEFLKFAGGVNLDFNFLELWGLDRIGNGMEYLEKDGFSGFCDIGAYGGDGRTICISENDGLFYEWDHGEMSKIGNLMETINFVFDI